MLVAEIVGAVNALGTLSTFYISESSFVTSPTDTPANTAFTPALLEPGSLGLHVFSDGRTGGSTKLEVGEMVLANLDGQFDDWVDYSFDGRAIVIRSGEVGAEYPDGFTTIFSGTMDGVEASWDKIVIRMRDKQYIFSTPFLTTKYAGTNVLPNGLEGTSNDIKDKVKPRVYGKVFNVTPAFINTSKLTFQVSDIPVSAISAVYDKGLALTPGADFATSTLLQAASPSAGTFITCLAEGMFRLGSSPAGIITADVTQGAAVSDRTVAQIVKLIAIGAGLSSSEINAADITAMDVANSSVVGIYISDESSSQDLIDQLLNSVGGYCGFDSTGFLRVGVLTTPSGTPVVSLYEYDIHEGIERRQPKDNGIPIYRVSLNHTKIYTVQPNDIAGAVTTPTRAYLAKEYRTAKSEDLTIKLQWLLSTDYSQDTLLTVESDAVAEAARQLALYKVRRDIFEVPVQSEIFTENNLKFMDVINLEIPRFGMDNGKLFMLVGYRYELASNKVYLQLWG